jgi:peptidoglycan/LPS O-acetylase OafA/YrhL
MKLSVDSPAPERSVAVHGRIPQLDGLRAVAILIVLLNHTLHVPLTWIGVDIFFVLSGFLITGILLELKLEGQGYFSYFYTRRFFRIVPSYVVTIVLFGSIISWNVFKPWPLFAFFGMNLQQFFHVGWIPFEPPLWSLAVEEQFYLVWPLVILLVSETTVLWLAVAAIVFTPLLRVICAPYFPTQFGIYTLTPFRADLLCAGAVLAILWKRRTALQEDLVRRRAWLGTVAGFGGLALVQIWPVLRLASNTRASNGLDYSLSVLGSFSLVAWALADRSWLRALLASAPMRFIGQISYTMYLIHILFLLLVEHYVHSPYLMAVATVGTTMLFSWISWVAMERPLMAYGAKLAPRRKRQPVAQAG